MHTFIVRAALRDEANEGWIWTDGFPSRTVVKITNCDGEKWFFQRRCVVCEVREFDRNFFAHYNKDRRLSVPENSRQPTVVLSHWYRSALGGFDTTASDNRTGRVKLVIKPMRLWGWRSLRAACHHPDIVVRLGTRLGVLGIWLGVLGVWPPIAQFLEIPGVWTKWLLVAGTVATLAAIYACKGPSRPPVPLANPRAQYSTQFADHHSLGRRPPFLPLSRELP